MALVARGLVILALGPRQRWLQYQLLSAPGTGTLSLLLQAAAVRIFIGGAETPLQSLK